MILSSLFASAASSLVHHRLRSALTVLGIVFGVAAVISMLAISEGAKAQALSGIQGMGLDNVIVRARQPSPGSKAAEKKEGDVQSYGPTRLEIGRLAAAVPGVREAVSWREVRGRVRVGAERAEGRIIAAPPAWQRVAGLRVARGRPMADLDRERRASVAVLGHDLAFDLFGVADPLGREVQLAGQWFLVVGVLAPGSGGGGLSAGEAARAAIIPDSTADMRLGLLSVQQDAGNWSAQRVEVSLAVLACAEGTDLAAAGALVRRVLNADERGDVEVVVPLELLEASRRTSRIFAVVMGSIAGISLIVGGIGIMNIMLATVLERTREIGVRRAVGARRRDIMAQFLVETLVLSSAGGMIGLLLGLFGAWLVGVAAGWPVLVTWWSVAAAVGVSGLVGVIFGLYPAMQASRLQPVEALRHV